MLRDDLAAAPLGHATGYPDAYDPSLLFLVPRAPQREAIGIVGTLPFVGSDRWTAFELTWLDGSGKPAIAIAAFDVPAASPAIVESKSVKLYLGAFAQTRFDNAAAVAATIERDLTTATGASVRVTLTTPAQFPQIKLAEMDGESLDALPLAIDRYEIDVSTLLVTGAIVTEVLRTDLFRSVCPITGQPDFASVSIAYTGPSIDRAGLLRYLVSFRCHAGFHEHCVERIFVDMQRACGCSALAVMAQFTRRGGVDINPWRSTAGLLPPAVGRTARQ
ncbi:MAG: NADPH-dependent 7-cyano-7-deazaguanine reductase QueF [Betaproteobacteria bacterium]